MRRQSPAGLMVIRLLLVSNGLLLGVIGALSLLYVERPAGLIAAGGAWALAMALFGCVRYTDSYRHES